MKYYELSKEEQELLNEVEKGEWISVPNFAKLKKYYREIARHTLNKTKNINIRVTERALHRLKAKAIEEGIPYQTLAASILHKYVNK